MAINWLVWAGLLGLVCANWTHVGTRKWNGVQGGGGGEDTKVEQCFSICEYTLYIFEFSCCQTFYRYKFGLMTTVSGKFMSIFPKSLRVEELLTLLLIPTDFLQMLLAYHEIFQIRFLEFFLLYMY